MLLRSSHSYLRVLDWETMQRALRQVETFAVVQLGCGGQERLILYRPVYKGAMYTYECCTSHTKVLPPGDYFTSSLTQQPFSRNRQRLSEDIDSDQASSREFQVSVCYSKRHIYLCFALSFATSPACVVECLAPRKLTIPFYSIPSLYKILNFVLMGLGA